MIGKAFLFFNWQLVKRLHHLRRLQLLVQVLKAAVVFALLWHCLSKTEKGGGDTEELVTGISSDQVDKRHRTCMDMS